MDRPLPYRFDDALRTTMVRNIERFVRQAIVVADRKPAAVALCIVSDDAGEACFVLTRRAASLRAHAGQWALPGGRVDVDETAVDGARREAAEEVGVRAGPGDVLGVLDDYPTRSGYVITPVLIWLGEQTELAPNPSEVESIHLIPLTELDRPDAPRLITIPESDHPVIQIPLLDHWIHAPTAAILLQVRDVALHGLDTRVSHFDQPTWAWR